MSLVLANNNGADTAVGGLASNPLALRILNLDADWTLISESSDRAIYKNNKGPLGFEDTIELATTVVKDAYKAFSWNIFEMFKTKYRTALQIMWQYHGFIPETDTVDTEHLAYVPYSTRIVTKVPMHPTLTSAQILGILKTTAALPWAKGVVATNADPVLALMRGSRKF